MSQERPYAKAADVAKFVSDTFASGENEWPIPRSALNGLRLKQVLDAIKIYMAQFYIETLNGSKSAEEYEQLKRSWGFILVSLSTAFTRDEEWEKVEHLEPSVRSVALRQKALDWASAPQNMNAEELELFNQSENLASFLGYVEKMARYSPDPLQHLLGHLSQGVIYIDEYIPLPSR